MQAENVFLVGIDVGSSSVRAGLYSLKDETILRVAVQPISVNNVLLQPDRKCFAIPVEGVSQSSDEIWQAVCKVVQEVVAGTDTNLIKGIGFDATCSLVVIGKDGKPLQINTVPKNNIPTPDKSYVQIQNVIMWMDHRAKNETEFINKQLADHQALRFVGGKVSLEMEIPKLLWLKTYLPETYNQATKFFDLADYLSWRASGDDRRSICTTVCKWLYQVNKDDPAKHGWDGDLLGKVGLEDLGLHRIGEHILAPGRNLGDGLTSQAAKELGLDSGTAVAIGLIDAHAGGLGLAYCRNLTKEVQPYKRLGLICGTSTCFMICSEKPKFVTGIWGPYYSAMIPDSWLSEGGQSASGMFLDHIVQTHPYYLTHVKNSENGNLTACYKYLNEKARKLVEEDPKKNNIACLSDGLHIFPDFHGNRSPVGNPEFKGMILGLTLDNTSELSFVRMYIAALQGLAYESRWIIETMVKEGIEIDDVAICGGLAKNPLFIQTLSSAIKRPVVLPHIKESVLLGSAMLAAAASGHFSSLKEAATRMAGSSDVIFPDSETEEYHDKRYQTFLRMADFQSSILKDIA